MRTPTKGMLLGLCALFGAQCIYAQSSALRIEGSVGYQRTGNQVELTAERICNRSTGGRSGTVTVGLWASLDADPKGDGYSVAETSLSSGPNDPATLEAGACFTNIQFDTTWTDPGADGRYYMHFYVAEHPNTVKGSGGLTSLDHVTFTNALVVGNPPPSTPPPAPPPASGVDDFGDTLATAAPIQTGTSTNGVLHSAGDADVFVLTLNSASTISIRSSGTTDTVGELLDANETVIDFSDDTDAGLNFEIPATALAAGTYYVRVTGFGGETTGAYTLHVSGTPQSPPPSTTPPPSSTPPPSPSPSTSTGSGGGGGGGSSSLFCAFLLSALLGAQAIHRRRKD